MALKSEAPSGQNWRRTVYDIIFEAETPTGKAFDIALLVSIVLSVVAVMLETVEPIQEAYGFWLRAAEWVFTILFSIEYVLRLMTVARPGRYAWSFFGMVDLISTVPMYVSAFIPGSHSFLIVRVLRLLRIFRVFKLGRYLTEANVLLAALKASAEKIIVFLGTVLTIALIMGSLMYLVEGAENGFTSIPRATYWAIVTMTTVGFGDIAPATPFGQFLAAALMLMGYSILAVPTGIVSVEVASAGRQARHFTTRACHECTGEGHDHDAKHCKYCGASLRKDSPTS